MSLPNNAFSVLFSKTVFSYLSTHVYDLQETAHFSLKQLLIIYAVENDYNSLILNLRVCYIIRTNVEYLN